MKDAPHGRSRLRSEVSPARAAAFTALRRMRKTGGRLDEPAADPPELGALGPTDRALANELVHGTVRRRGSIDAVLSTYTQAPLTASDPDVLEALRLSAFQLLFLDRVPAYAAVDEGVTLARRVSRRTAGFANAVLRHVAREGRATLAELGAGDDDRSWATALSYPVWLVRRLRDDLGDGPARRVLEAGDGTPERCLRVNRLRGDSPTITARLTAEGFGVTGIDGLPHGLLYEGVPLGPSSAFEDGLVTPQSRGSQIAGLVAAGGVTAPRATVLDMCAAPGVKTSQLAALLRDASITACEVDQRRVSALRTNLRRLGVSSVSVVHGDVLDPRPEWDAAFDAVLLDAPCSGLGTLSSRPDLRWRRRPEDVVRMARRQRRLLERAMAVTRPGGVLTYAVCTLTRAETVGVVGPLLTTPGWETDDLGAEWPGLAHPAAGGSLLILPPGGGASGFFIARLRRTA